MSQSQDLRSRGCMNQAETSACAHEPLLVNESNYRACILEELEKLRGKSEPYSNVLPQAEDTLKEQSIKAAQLEVSKALEIFRRVNHKDIGPFDLNTLHFKNFLLRGFSHLRHRSPCQDSAVICTSKEGLVVAQSDGVSGCESSHLGSFFLTNLTADVVLEQLKQSNRETDGRTILSADFLGEIHHKVRMGIFGLANASGWELNHLLNRTLAATIQIAIITPKETLVVALGDGALEWKGVELPIEAIAPRNPEIARAMKLIGYQEPPPPTIQASFLTEFWAGAHLLAPQAELAAQLVGAEAMAFRILAYGDTRSVFQNNSLAFSKSG